MVDGCGPFRVTRVVDAGGGAFCVALTSCGPTNYCATAMNDIVVTNVAIIIVVKTS